MIGYDGHVNPARRPGSGITVSDYGRFVGFVFVFDRPVRARDGRMIKRLDLTGACLDGDISPQEVIRSLLFPLPDEELIGIEAGDFFGPVAEPGAQRPVPQEYDLAYPKDVIVRCPERD